MKKGQYSKVGVSRSWQAVKIFDTCGVFMIIFLFLCHVVPCLAAEKETFPSQKINWLVPYKAGGGQDLIARGIAPYLSQYLQKGSPESKGGIVIRNEPASGGRKAYNMLYNAKRDGYTIGAFDAGFIAETFTEDVGFDISKLTFMARMTKAVKLVVTSKNGFANWEELIKAAKIRPLKWGVGAYLLSTHLDSIVLTESMGIPVRFIAWAGGTSENMNALMRGDIQVAMVSEDSVQGLVDAGEIKPILVVSEKSKYPGVPTVKDLGHPELAEKLGTMRFIVAPPGLPGNIKNAFISALTKTMNDQSFLSYAKKRGLDFKPVYGEEAEKAFKSMNRYYQNELKALYIKYSKIS